MNCPGLQAGVADKTIGFSQRIGLKPRAFLSNPGLKAGAIHQGRAIYEGQGYSEGRLASLINSGINFASGKVGQCLTGSSLFIVLVFSRNGLKIDR